MFDKKTIKDIDLCNKTVLLRADYNVPISYDEKGNAEILSDFRIRASLPTLSYLLNNGVKKIVIISHLGRPNSITSIDEINQLQRLKNGEFKFSLKPVFLRLSKILEDENILIDSISFRDDLILAGNKFNTEETDSRIEILENLRFCKLEKENSIEFAQALLLASEADIFVQDGFGIAHRKHASTSKITEILPSVAGLLVEKEFSTINEAIAGAKKPLTIVVGGAKISDKLPMIKKLVDRADNLILGGAIANTFLKYYGFDIGDSKFEEGQEDNIRTIENLSRLKFGENFRKHLILPIDFGVAKNFSREASRHQLNIRDVSKNDVILDVGDGFIRYIADILKRSNTIIWNGTVGMAEFDKFSTGSKKIAEAISAATKSGAISVVGGGDTSAFAIGWSRQNPLLAEFSLISTGGGAALKLLSGERLPGIDALLDKHKNLQNN